MQERCRCHDGQGFNNRVPLDDYGHVPETVLQLDIHYPKRLRLQQLPISKVIEKE